MVIFLRYDPTPVPRPLRIEIPNQIYHVINRANHRFTIFTKQGDYAAFEKILFEGLKKARVSLFAYVLMPNHWHLVLAPKKEGEVSKYLHWITSTHTHRWNENRRLTGNGHLYQGRYKSFMVDSEKYFLSVCRFVESNPFRSALVERAETWRWTSLWHRTQPTDLNKKIADWPINFPTDYLNLVNTKNEEEAASKELLTSLNFSIPYGSATWKQTLPKNCVIVPKPRGRPPKLY
jgi:putative transposase